ncbi:hypothetical protein [Spiroplasma endosymbiont of Atherix ibis]
MTELFKKYGFNTKDENSYKEIIEEVNNLVIEFKKILLKNNFN